MIILELEIRDFKQFRGRHLFSPTESGVVGIIGPNGAGKTTLFEAIEWCLYAPRNIHSDEIPPRGSTDSQPHVRLRLGSTLSGDIFEITRTVKRSSVDAEVRRLHKGESELLASGASTVRRYVAGTLIGMEYKAFVATFFTRQKELSFFGSLLPTERRREVGRMLGLETIRKAQEQIAEERRQKRSLVDGYRAQYARESAERDFERERKALEQQRVELQDRVDNAGEAIAVAERNARDLAREHDAIVARREQVLQLRNELAVQRAAIDLTKQSAASHRSELERLDSLASQREGLAATASRLPELERTVADLEEQRTRFEAISALSKQITDVEGAIADAETRACEILAGHRVPRPANGFVAPAIGEFLDEHGIDLTPDLQRRLSVFEESSRIWKDLEQLRTECVSFEDLLTTLQAKQALDQAELECGPGIEDLQNQFLEGERTIANHQASIDQFRNSIRVYRQFAGLTAPNAATSLCPTCGRPIAEHELDATRAHVSALTNDLNSQIGRLEHEIAHIRQIGAETQERTHVLTEISRRLTEREQRIAVGRGKVEQHHERIGRAELTLADLLRTASVDAPPTDEMIGVLRDDLQREQQIARDRGRLADMAATLERATNHRADLSARLGALGEVEFDEAALRTARMEQAEAQSARTRLDEIERQLARRSEHELAVQIADQNRSQAEAKAAEVNEQIEAVPFAEEELENARAAHNAAVQDVRRRTSEREASRRELQEAAFQLQRLADEEARVAGLAKLADDATVAADELDRMYQDFNRFEQFVARRVRPQLEDLTSDLVQEMTEGKYTGIQLDDDYGITVADGENGFFPLHEFSGGERDVISLAARLALSRLIGSQATNPPSFLVLDEVFGSLDRDRRTNVLEMLAGLAGSAEAFQQLFVISHVDDVRASAAFTEVWRVVEDGDGFSSIENLNESLVFEDL